jgi:tetratricopeptide (TPR) repeat protein
MKLHAFLSTALAVVVLSVVAIPPADAQRRASGRTAAETPREAMFPHAVRDEPSTRITQRMSQRLERLYELASEEGNAQRVIDQANELINDRNATDYVRSFAYVQMGEAYDEMENVDAAIDAYRKAIDGNGLANDNHYQVMLRLGQTLVFEERIDEGIEVLNRFFEETRSENPQFLALMGSSLYQAERYDGAIDYLTRAIAASDNPQPGWQQLLMASYAESDQMDQAAIVAEQSVQANPDDKQAVMNLAAVLAQGDNLERAAQVLNDARNRGLFTEGRDYDQLARIYMNIDEGEREAAAVISEGMDRGLLERNHANYNLLGQALYFSEQFQGAIAAWTEAAKTAPDGETALNLARVHYEEENWRQAKEFANQAIQRGIRNPDTARAIINNADIELRR